MQLVTNATNRYYRIKEDAWKSYMLCFLNVILFLTCAQVSSKLEINTNYKDLYSQIKKSTTHLHIDFE